MGALAAMSATGAVSRLQDFKKLAKLGTKFNEGEDVGQIVDDIWEMCKSVPTASGTPFSKVFIRTRVAKEFDGVNLSEWSLALDDEMFSSLLHGDVGLEAVEKGARS